MSLILKDYNAIPLIPELAVVVGVNGAIILQQVHYWCEKSKESGTPQIDGFCWVYNSYRAWNNQFPWISDRSLKEEFKKLEERGFLVSGNYNKQKYDRTKWYRVDYAALAAAVPKVDFCTMDGTEFAQWSGQNLPNGIDNTCTMEGAEFAQPIPKNNHKTLNKDYITERVDRPASCESVQQLFNEICKSFPSCSVLSRTMREEIQGRINDGFSLDDFRSLFIKAEKSSFLKGKNESRWSASFDWLIKPNNMAKVLNGNYDDRKQDGGNPYDYDDDDLDFIPN